MNQSVQHASRTLRSVMILAVSAMASVATAMAASTPQPYPGEAAFRDLYRELVETNTTLSVGSCTAAAEKWQRDCSGRACPPRPCRSWRPRNSRRAAR